LAVSFNISAWVTVNQRGYLARMLEKFDMAGCNGRLNPMESSRMCKRKADDSKADMDIYRQAIGCLLYAALGSRPDIAYAVGVLGRHSADPGPSHMQAARHLFRYLKRTTDYELPIYDPERAPPYQPEQHPVVAYADADFGGDRDGGGSTSAYLVYARGTLITWKSKKQTIVAQSTMEAELIASATAMRTVNWMTGFLSEIEIGNGSVG